jgi:transmembrane sensor
MSEESSLLVDEAAAWVASMDRGDWTPSDEAGLQAWLAGDSMRAGALLQAQAVWIATGEPLAAETMPVSPWHDRRRFLMGSAAALIASAAGGGFLWFSANRRYETAVGEIRRVPLEDGSIATINTSSRIDVALIASRRNIRLDRGEAWFKVAKDPARPFLVEAGDVLVRAVGTAFSVHRRSGGAEVLVTEGVVEAWAAGTEESRVRLIAGQRAFLASDAVLRIEPAGPSDVDRALAWRNGKIDLIGETLGDAIDDFNRYNARQIVLLDPTLASERFDGIFGTDDPEGFAIAVKSSLNVPLNLSNPDKICIGQQRT